MDILICRLENRPPWVKRQWKNHGGSQLIHKEGSLYAYVKTIVSYCSLPIPQQCMQISWPTHGYCIRQRWSFHWIFHSRLILIPRNQMINVNSDLPSNWRINWATQSIDWTFPLKVLQDNSSEILPETEYAYHNLLYSPTKITLFHPITVTNHVPIGQQKFSSKFLVLNFMHTT
jgi:hypothetical protein